MGLESVLVRITGRFKESSSKKYRIKEVVQYLSSCLSKSIQVNV